MLKKIIVPMFSREMAQMILDGKVKGLAWNGTPEQERKMFGSPLNRKVKVVKNEVR